VELLAEVLRSASARKRRAAKAKTSPAKEAGHEKLFTETK